MFAELRGTGFLQGVRCPTCRRATWSNKLQSLGLLVPPAGENVIRVFPALIADKAGARRGHRDPRARLRQSFEAAAKAAE